MSAAVTNEPTERALNNLLIHFAGLFTAQPEAWTIALGVITFRDDELPCSDQPGTQPSLGGWLGNHSGAWPIRRPIFEQEAISLLDDLARARADAWHYDHNVVLFRLHRPTPTHTGTIDASIRAFYVHNPKNFVSDPIQMTAVISRGFN